MCSPFSLCVKNVVRDVEGSLEWDDTQIQWYKEISVVFRTSKNFSFYDPHALITFIEQEQVALSYFYDM